MPTEEWWTVDAWNALGAALLALLPRVGLAILTFAVFWLIGVFVQRLVSRLSGRARALDAALVVFIGQCAKITLVIVGAISALGTLGINVTALVAGLGLTGFALGFAMKDMVSNALSGFLVLFYRPFTYGDVISVTALEGKVSEINFRYTVLEADGKWIYVPNANLFTNPVIVTRRSV